MVCFTRRFTEPSACWAAKNGVTSQLSPAERASIPVDGCCRLSFFFRIEKCRDVLVDYRDGIATLIWDVNWAHSSALNQAMAFVREYRPAGGIRLHALLGAWYSTKFATFHAAELEVRRIEGLRGLLLFPQTYIREMSLRDMRNESAYHTNFFDSWRLALREGRIDALDYVSRESIIYERRGRSAPLRLGYLGPNHSSGMVYGGNWATGAALEEDLQDEWDEKYEFHVMRVYDDVIDVDEPRYDHIHAFIRVKGGLPRWWRYRRLLLPRKLSDGSGAVYSLSEQYNDIDVGFVRAA